MKQYLFILFTVLFLFSCSPTITTKIYKHENPLDYNKNIYMLSIFDNMPDSTDEIGETKIGDSGFTTKCDFDYVLECARLEARKSGGNILKLLELNSPDRWSKCYRLKAKILKNSNYKEVKDTTTKDSLVTLNIYRRGTYGFLISYNLHLGDTILGDIGSNFKKTIKLKKEGYYSLWAKTEVKEEVPIKLVLGNEYYIKCSLTMGFFVGHPKIEVVNKLAGKLEFESLKNN